jgi:hypothetical protein
MESAEGIAIIAAEIGGFLVLFYGVLAAILQALIA